MGASVEAKKFVEFAASNLALKAALGMFTICERQKKDKNSVAKSSSFFKF